MNTINEFIYLFNREMICRNYNPLLQESLCPENEDDSITKLKLKYLNKNGMSIEFEK